MVMDLIVVERRFPGFYDWFWGSCEGCGLMVDLREAGQGTFMVSFVACRLSPVIAALRSAVSADLIVRLGYLGCVVQSDKACRYNRTGYNHR